MSVNYPHHVTGPSGPWINHLRAIQSHPFNSKAATLDMAAALGTAPRDVLEELAAYIKAGKHHEESNDGN